MDDPTRCLEEGVGASGCARGGISQSIFRKRMALQYEVYVDYAFVVSI